MTYNFTGRAKKAIEIANEVAIELGHNYIGTEHILYGLAKEGSGVASKVLENQLVVIDELPFKDIKTKQMVSALEKNKVEGKTLIMLPEKNEAVQKSARNIEGVKTTLVNTINVYDLLKYNKLVITLDTVKKLEEVYA